MQTRKGLMTQVGGWLAAVAFLAGAFIFVTREGGASESAFVIPPAAMTETVPADATTETAVVAGGCFWGVQLVFQHVKGVKNVLSGYAGGSAADADYDAVSSGSTGHAESVEIVFDPREVNYATILQIFFSVAHDPTQLNKQGPDYGTQYRSAIFVANESQRKVAEAYIAQLDAAKVYPAPIVTQVSDLETFYPAEDYHQDYATLHPDSGYIVYNDLPKAANLSRIFPDLYRSEPKLVSQSATN
jgi:peptide-methionine (S)-S-oxide reductase